MIDPGVKREKVEQRQKEAKKKKKNRKLIPHWQNHPFISVSCFRGEVFMDFMLRNKGKGSVFYWVIQETQINLKESESSISQLKLDIYRHLFYKIKYL